MSSARILRASRVILLASLTGAGVAQQGKQLTTEDYARAERFMNYNVNPLVYHSVERPMWLEDGRFWYRDRAPEGTTYTLVDPAKATKGPAFDHTKLANALNAAGVKADAHNLAISEFALSDHDKTVVATVSAKHFSCNLAGAGLCLSTDPPGSARGQGEHAEGGRVRAAVELSPDKTKAAFIRR